VFDGVDFGGTTEFAAPTYESIRDNIEALRALVGFSADPVNAGLLYTPMRRTWPATGSSTSAPTTSTARRRSRQPGEDPRRRAATDRHPEIDEGSERTSCCRTPASARASTRRAAARCRVQDADAAELRRPQPGADAWRLRRPTAASARRATLHGNGGNPFLRPFTSWNFDAAAEFYFARTGFASITGFHRRIKGFIQQNTFDVDRSDARA
jgi:iron complex outermembrane receptor protein